MAIVPDVRISPEEYLRIERAAETKSEYDGGVMYAMAGASREHGLIIGNLGWALRNRLPASCRAFPSEMKVRVLAQTRFFYPDTSIVCGKESYADDARDVLLNPLIIFEVLSPATEKFDRGRKFISYRSIESLQEYVLVTQDAYLIEHFRRDGERWILTTIEGRDAQLKLPSVNSEIPLADIYYQVEL